MQNIRILERVKSRDDKILGYFVHDCELEYQFFISAKTFCDNITCGFYTVENATLMANGDFRAKPGYKIKTVIGYKERCINSSPAMSNFQRTTSFSEFPADYYGQEFINVCRKIRTLAIQDKIVIEDTDQDIHLIKLIESCGIDVMEFVKSYWSVVQPYSFEAFQRVTSEDKSLIWNVDIGYRVRLTIKLDEGMESNCLSVSFHKGTQLKEIGGVTRLSQTSEGIDFSDKLCAVIVDEVSATYLEGGQECSAHIAFTLQRSFIRSNVKVIVHHMNKGIALVEHSKVEDIYQDEINHLLNGLQDIYYEGTEEQRLRLIRNHVFFLGYKYSVANNVCLLLDCFTTYTDSIRRSVVLEVVNDLLSKIPIESAPELRAALDDKYGRIIGYDNGLYRQILLCCEED